MKVELPYFNVEKDFGGDQHKLDRFIMRKGGCAAVTACDCCIYFELYKNLRGLYPYDVKNISYKNYRQFSEIMTPYLHPRMGGIDKLETYIDGFKKVFNIWGLPEWYVDKNGMKIDFDYATKKLQYLKSDSDMMFYKIGTINKKKRTQTKIMKNIMFLSWINN